MWINPKSRHWAPISLIVANLFMEEFETKAINTAAKPSRLWRRYVDDTFVIQRTKHRTQFLQHLSSNGPHMLFIMEEEPNTDGFLPFLDTPITAGPDSKFIITVHRKPTQTITFHGIATTIFLSNTVCIYLYT